VVETRGRTTQKRVPRRSSPPESGPSSRSISTDFKSSASFTFFTTPTRTERQRTSVFPAAIPSAVSKRTRATGPWELRLR